MLTPLAFDAAFEDRSFPEAVGPPAPETGEGADSDVSEDGLDLPQDTPEYSLEDFRRDLTTYTKQATFRRRPLLCHRFCGQCELLRERLPSIREEFPHEKPIVEASNGGAPCGELGV